jgi:molecular chaperone GrpE
MSSKEEKEKLEKPEESELLDTPEHLLMKCEEEREEYLNGWKRAKADLLNYQKDEAERVENVIRFLKENIVNDILPVLESLDLGLGLGSISQDNEVLKIVSHQLKESLKRHGLNEIVVEVGDVFDPSIHESVGEMKSEEDPGTVVVEVRKGYKLYEKTIKAAQVKLSTHIN